MAAQTAPVGIEVFLRHSAHRIVLLGAEQEIFLIAVTRARDHDIERGIITAKDGRRGLKRLVRVLIYSVNWSNSSTETGDTHG
jgi:hypothetical protein